MGHDVGHAAGDLTLRQRRAEGRVHDREERAVKIRGGAAFPAGLFIFSYLTNSSYIPSKSSGAISVFSPGVNPRCTCR
jgi:hypothetical protein